MTKEWQDYKDGCIEGARKVIWSLGVSLVLWLCQLPETPKAQYGISFIISMVYGLAIFSCIWLSFAIFYLALIFLKIKVTDEITSGWKINGPVGLFGCVWGLLLGKWLESIISQQAFSLSGFIQSVLVGALISLLFTFYYAYKTSLQENLKLQAAKAESELHVFKNQMQPHFLFNSLNSLAELIETKHDSASEVAMKLSDLYREILENSKKSLASLSSEVSIIQKYLELEKIRFGDRLSFAINIPERADSIVLPPLVLQTLVENAIKHGIAPTVEGGTVNVSVADEAKGFKLRVLNTGFGESKKQGSRTGLENTRARLDLLYGEKHGFALKDLGQAFEASFWFSGETT